MKREGGVEPRGGAAVPLGDVNKISEMGLFKEASSVLDYVNRCERLI